jgi:hypothetical protein
VPLVLQRVLVEGAYPERPNELVEIRHQATQVVFGTVVTDGLGRFSVQVPFGIFLAAVGAGRAEAVGTLGVQTDPGALSGAAAGQAGAGGPVAQAQPLSGAAAGLGTAGGVPAGQQSLIGAAPGVASVAGTVVGAPVVGSAAGVAGASGVLGVAGGGGGDITQVGTAQVSSGSNFQATLPGGIQQDDVIFLATWTATPASTPSGYTHVWYTPNANAQPKVFRKIAGASETAPTVNTSGVALTFALRGVDLTTPVEAVHGSTASTGSSGTNPTCTVSSITTLSDGAWVIAIAAATDSGWDDGESSGPNTSFTWGSATGAATSLIGGDDPVLGNLMYAIGAWYSVKASAGASGTTGLSGTLVEAWPGYSVGLPQISAIHIVVKPA